MLNNFVLHQPLLPQQGIVALLSLKTEARPTWTEVKLTKATTKGGEGRPTTKAKPALIKQKSRDIDGQVDTTKDEVEN